MVVFLQFQLTRQRMFLPPTQDWPEFWYEKCKNTYKEEENIFSHFFPANVLMEKPCLVFVHKDQVIMYTYKQIHEMCSRVAMGFDKLGIQKGDRVFLRILARPDAIISLLALWKIGAIPVLSFVTCGTNEVTFMQQDSQAKYCLVHDDCVDKFVNDPCKYAVCL